MYLFYFFFYKFYVKLLKNKKGENNGRIFNIFSNSNSCSTTRLN